MKTITKTFFIYRFDELSQDAQDRAVSDQIDFEIEVMDEDSWLWPCVMKMREMQTPWFLGSYIWENHREDIIHNIQDNEYLYFKNGELIPREYYPDYPYLSSSSEESLGE